MSGHSACTYMLAHVVYDEDNGRNSKGTMAETAREQRQKQHRGNGRNSTRTMAEEHGDNGSDVPEPRLATQTLEVNERGRASILAKLSPQSLARFSKLKRNHSEAKMLGG